MTPNTVRIALVALTLATSAACGNGGDDTTASTGVATLESAEDDALDDADSSDDTDSLDTDDSLDTTEAPEDPELAFALYDECMTEAGFDFGTTIVGSGDGGIAVDEVAIDEIDPQSDGFTSPEDFDEAFQAADAECRAHLANLDQSFDLTPEQEAELADAQLEWAECMRGLGVDVPDLDSSGGGVIAVEIGPGEGDDPQSPSFGGADFDFEAFEEAAAECDIAFADLDASLGEDSP